MTKRINNPVWLLAYQASPRFAMAQAKSRAKDRGRLFDITREEFEALWPTDSRCRYCKQEMVQRTMTAPSVDEVIPGRGYVHGNIDIICRKCNSLKNAGSLEFHLAVAHRMVEVEQSFIAQPDPPREI